MSGAVTDASEWARRVAPLAIVAASGVAVIYLPQPIQTLVADGFRIAASAAAIAPVAVQLGYALGLILFVSMGDRFSPRAQVSAQMAATALSIAAAALAPSYSVYVVACFVSGATASYGQLIIATALRSAPEESRSRIVAVLLGAFLVGLFLVRTGLGATAGALGWRAVLLGIAALVLVLLVPARLSVPHESRDSPPGIWQVISSLPGVARRSPALMLMSATHAIAFAGFIAAWATSTLLAIDTMGLSVTEAALPGIAGMLGGAVGILLARVHRRLGSRRSVLAAIIVLFSGAALLAVGGTWLPGLVVGLFLMSVGLITSQVTTQAHALAAVAPAETGRANTVYTATTFFAGGLATWIADALFRAAGFPAVGLLVTATALVALALTIVAIRRGVIR